MLAIVMGVFSCTLTTEASMSPKLLMRPIPRITYSARLISMVRAPTSTFDIRTEAKISSSVTP